MLRWLLNWLPIMFQMAVVIMAAFGIMFVVLVILWLFQDQKVNRLVKSGLCDICGRDTKGGALVEVCADCANLIQRQVER